MTHDVPSLHENGMMPVLNIQTWVETNNENKQQITHTFYKKGVASKYTILQRSAISKQCKRATNVQEGLRRLRNISKCCPWSEKARVLSNFSNMLYISGYSEKYRYNIIKGVISRHKEIIKMKQNKGGNSANTWFLTSEINNILMTTATPNSELATKLKESLNKQPQRANGRTKPIEKGGLPISIGLKKKTHSG